MADLQACVVEAGSIGLVRLVGDGRKRGGKARVGDCGLLEQFATREAVRSEQLAVVGRDACVLVACADHPDERAQAVPELGRSCTGRCAKGRVAAILSEDGRTPRAVGGRIDGQVATRLDVKQEHEPEYERERGLRDAL